MRRILAFVAPLAGLCVLSWCQTFWSAASIATLPGCSEGDAGGIQPITGVEVLSSELIAGRGCGTGINQIYKYVVVAQIPFTAGYPFDGSFIAGGVYDCFSDAVLQQLCTYPYGTVNPGPNSSAFAITVYAYTAAQWNSPVDDGGTATVGSVAEGAFATPQAFAGYPAYCTAASASPPIEENPAIVVPAVTLEMGVLNSLAVWRTTCSAVEQSFIPVIANCAPLQSVQQ